jgi:hypothetical protein
VTALLLVPLGVAEVATRAMTRTIPETGMQAFVGIPLLPYRPSPDQVRAWIARNGPGEYLQPDAELGWTIRPGGRTADGRYEANAQAARARQDVVYETTVPPGRRRVIAVGDSFTHGDGVTNEQTWAYRLERIRGDLEVVNFGVPGYGTDQAFLRWRRDAAPLRADFAVLGIWPENMCRNLNLVRYFLQPGAGFSGKPRFLVTADGGLDPIGLPVLDGDALVAALSGDAPPPVMAHEYWAQSADVAPRWFQHSRLLRVVHTLARVYERRAQRNRLYAGTDPLGIEVTVAIARRFATEARARGAEPIVLLIPMRDLLETWPDEGALPLARALRAQGIEPIDLGPPMTRVVRERGEACCFAADGHLSVEGNELVAGWLAERIAATPAAAAAERR